MPLRLRYPAIAMLLSAVAMFAASQPYHIEFRPFAFTNLPGADVCSGGIDLPSIQFVDIDGDRDFDLFLLDRDGHLNFYRNTGDSATAVFQLVSIDFQHLNTGTWFHFVDLDADGDFDLLTNGPSNTIQFYRNTGTKFSPSFILEQAALKDTSGTLILAESISVPTLADPDGDGDLDLFVGNSVGSIAYYENIGTPQNFQFRFVTDKYQNISIIGSVGKTGRHGAMAIAFNDVDADGDLDLFWGDFFNRSLYFLQNQGTPNLPQYILVDSTFADEAPVQTFGFNMPNLVDIDGDGDPDMFITTLSGASTFNNFIYYKNTGTKFVHQFTKQTENYLQTVDLGSNSVPVFADPVVAGRFDLFVGSEDGRLAHYTRSGTPRRPQFSLDTEQFVSLPGLFNIVPAFGDLDGDGQQELMVGDANGRLRLFRQNSGWSQDTSFPMKDTIFGQNAAPVLFDIDNDGDLDLFVGAGNGRVSFFRNDGNRLNAVFSSQSRFYSAIDVGDDAVPTFADVDGDGKVDLVVGSRETGLHFYKNSGTTNSPLFSEVLNAFPEVLSGFRFAPSFFDADGDGDADLLLGNVKGGLFFFRNERITTSVAEGQGGQEEFVRSQNYPNPFNPSTNIIYQLSRRAVVRLCVFDVLGREVASVWNGERGAGRYTAEFSAAGLPAGVYFYRISLDGSPVQTKSMLLLK